MEKIDVCAEPFLELGYRYTSWFAFKGFFKHASAHPTSANQKTTTKKVKPIDIDTEGG